MQVLFQSIWARCYLCHSEDHRRWAVWRARGESNCQRVGNLHQEKLQGSSLQALPEPDWYIKSHTEEQTLKLSISAQRNIINLLTRESNITREVAKKVIRLGKSFKVNFMHFPMLIINNKILEHSHSFGQRVQQVDGRCTKKDQHGSTRAAQVGSDGKSFF